MNWKHSGKVPPNCYTKIPTVKLHMHTRLGIRFALWFNYTLQMCWTAISISITSVTSADQLFCWPLSPNPDLAFEMQVRSEKPGLSINSWWGKQSGRWGLVTSVWRLAHLIVLLSPLSGLQLGSWEHTEPTVQGTRTVTGNMARTSSQSLMVQRRLFARPLV